MISRQVDVVREACEAWFPGQRVDVVDLDGDGFSGGCVRRVRVAWFDGVLKSFPAAARDRVVWSHALMRHLRAAGCSEVPDVMATPLGDTTVVTADGRGWEVVRFVDGAATDDPSAAQAVAAGAALARLHAAARTWPAAPPQLAAAPAVCRRIEHARRLLASPWGSLRVSSSARPDLIDAIAPRLARAVAIVGQRDGERALRLVAAATTGPLPLQAVLRDVWSGHVIFATDEPTRVAGVIDLHAAGIDTPATDVARLLGSWRAAAGQLFPEAWPMALAAYERVQPLTAAERTAVPWLHATGTIFALDNWFRWCLVEDRLFGKVGRVAERVDALLGRLEAAFLWLVGSADAV